MKKQLVSGYLIVLVAFVAIICSQCVDQKPNVTTIDVYRDLRMLGNGIREWEQSMNNSPYITSWLNHDLFVHFYFHGNFDQNLKDMFSRWWDNINHPPASDSLHNQSAIFQEMANDYIDLFACKFNKEVGNIVKLKNHCGQDAFLDEDIYLERLSNNMKIVVNLYTRNFPKDFADRFAGVDFSPRLYLDVDSKKIFDCDSTKQIRVVNYFRQDLYRLDRGMKLSETRNSGQWVELCYFSPPIAADVELFNYNDTLVYNRTITGQWAIALVPKKHSEVFSLTDSTSLKDVLIRYGKEALQKYDEEKDKFDEAVADGIAFEYAKGHFIDTTGSKKLRHALLWGLSGLVKYFPLSSTPRVGDIKFDAEFFWTNIEPPLSAPISKYVKIIYNLPNREW